MKTKLFLFLSMLISISSFAQDCPTGSVVLATQAEVDAFVAQYPNCTEIDGDLFVGNFGANPPVNDITDISGLNSIESVANTLGIFRTSLTTLTSFNNLTSVNSLQINNNPEITNISGFNNLIEAQGVVFGNNAVLTEIAGFSSIESLNSLQIQGGHPVLNSVTGFSNLETIAGLFRIGDFTNQINDISGFSSLENVGLLYVIATQLTDLSILDGVTIEAETARIDIQNNPVLTSLPNLNFVGPVRETIIFNNPLLTDLTGLESLTKSNVWIENNAGLTSLNGLQGLQESNKWVPSAVGVRILNNQNLTNLDALSNLEDLDETNIQVTNNANLNDISGLDNVSVSTINQLNVSGNTNLATCGSVLVCEYIFINEGNGLTFSNNGAGCNSLEDVETNCATVLDGLCPTGNLFFTTETQINRFGEFYTNCTEVENLTVIAPNETTDLSMFDNLVTVNGTLRIGTTQGTSLSGFHNVENVNFITIDVAPLVESLDVLGNVQGTVTKLEVSGSTELITINSFGTFELNYLQVSGNTSLTNLNFLNGVSLVAGEYIAFGPNGNTLEFRAPSLQITNNHSLTSLDGLSVPNSLFNLYLAGHQLNDLSSLNTLENLDHAFALFNTEEVENLDFLSGLTTFSVGEMYIGNNLGLENLDAFNGVVGNFDSASYIEISENPNLATCESSFICAIVDEFEAGGGDGAALVETEPYEGGGGNILFIYDNAEGCNSVEEIENACETFSTETFLASDINIFPNPFSNELNITLPSEIAEAKIRIVNIAGKVIFQKEIKNNQTNLTNLANLQSGLYFLQVELENKQKLSFKIIK